MKKKLLFLSLFILFVFAIPLVQFLIFNSTKSSRVPIQKQIEAPFLDSVNENIVILVFGYVGCDTICNVNFKTLNKIIESKELKNNLDLFKVVFVNLAPQVDEEQVKLFTQAYNENFQGIYMSKKELFKIDRTFSLFFSDSLFDNTTIEHTGYLYLLSKTKEKTILHSMYKQDSTQQKELTTDTLNLLKGQQ